MQSLDRIHRIGLDPKIKVKYVLLVGAGTVDEIIHNRLAEKITSMHKALDDDLNVLDLETSREKISDIQLDQDFQRVYNYLKKRKRENVNEST